MPEHAVPAPGEAGGFDHRGADRRSERRADRRRVRRSWVLHGFVLAGAVGAVALDRRLRRWRRSSPSTAGPAAAAVGFHALMFVAEQRHPLDEGWRPTRAEVATDLACLGATLGVASVADEIGSSLVRRSGRTAAVGRLPTWAGATVCLLAFDLVHSRFHQLLHVWGPGWRLHAVHHSSRGLYWVNAGRNQVVEIAVDGFIEGLVIRLLGPSRVQRVAYQAVRVMYGNLQHANVDLRSGVLDRVLSTPDLHRWHHSTVYEEGDANFGVFTSLWDQLFGTFYRPADRERPDQLGVGRMPEFPTRFVELQRVPLDWPAIRERNAATWFGAELGSDAPTDRCELVVE